MTNSINLSQVKNMRVRANKKRIFSLKDGHIFYERNPIAVNKLLPGTARQRCIAEVDHHWEAQMGWDFKPKEKKDSTKYLFMLRNNRLGTSFYLSAETARAASEWVHRLRRAIVNEAEDSAKNNRP